MDDMFLKLKTFLVKFSKSIHCNACNLLSSIVNILPDFMSTSPQHWVNK